VQEWRKVQQNVSYIDEIRTVLDSWTVCFEKQNNYIDSLYVAPLRLFVKR
jgi:hypothetical protein